MAAAPPSHAAVARHHDEVAEAFAATIAAVPPDRWSSPSPCEGWTARDVVRHVIEAHGLFLQLVGRELGPVPPVEEDPDAAFAAARAAVAAELADPERAAATYDGMFGTLTFADGVERFLCTDLVVHRWDLARAAGGDDRLPPDELRRIGALTAGFGDAMRTPGGFGPALEPPPDADEQVRLLALLGRRSW